MMPVGIVGVVIGHAEARIYAEAHEPAARSQIHERIAVRIARERMYARARNCWHRRSRPIACRRSRNATGARRVIRSPVRQARSGGGSERNRSLAGAHPPRRRGRLPASAMQRSIDEHAQKRCMREENIAALGIAEFVLHPVGLDDYGHAGLDPLAQRIGGVEAEKAKEAAHAVRHGSRSPAQARRRRLRDMAAFMIPTPIPAAIPAIPPL